MAAAHSLLSEEQLLCSICLDVFDKPVSIPCGHNFCRSCITAYWDGELTWQCPLCKDTFAGRPDLKVNTLISELAVQFKVLVNVSGTSTSSSPDQQPHSVAREVVCDICTEPKLKALKSCLDCPASYCETHLEPHDRVAGLRRHTLTDPVENLEERICKEHNRLLTLFCRKDLICLCEVCTEAHKTHETVPLQEEYEWRKAQLQETEVKVQQMIQERLQKVQEVKRTVKLGQKEAENAMARIVQDYSALVAFIERNQAELIGVIEGKQKASEKEAEETIRDLEKEITDLIETSTELKHLLHTADRLHPLQNPSTQSILPQAKDWSRTSVDSCQGIEDVRSFKSSMSQVEFALDEMRFALKEFHSNVLSKAALGRMQQHEVEVILDPDTAQRNLSLSTDGKQVKYGAVMHLVPENPKRIHNYLAVLGKRGYSGKFYYEVQVGRKVEWNLGVASESMTRNGAFVVSPDSGMWVIGLTVDKYEAFTVPRVPVYRRRAETVGVFVDYEKGQVSFYDVENRALIYSFTGYTFTEKLYPYLNPCDNEYLANLAPLVISPVNHSA